MIGIGAIALRGLLNAIGRSALKYAIGRASREGFWRDVLKDFVHIVGTEIADEIIKSMRVKEDKIRVCVKVEIGGITYGRCWNKENE